MVARAPLPWFGGKQLLAPRIVALMPPHRVYVEPFGGMASVLLTKPPAAIEVYNDLDDDLYNLFTVMRDSPKQLAEAVRLTPPSLQDFAGAVRPKDAVDRARMFAHRLVMGYGALGRRNPGSFVANRAADWRRRPELILQAAERLRGVVLEHRPALEVIRRYDGTDTLFYVDPPYLPETRESSSRRVYRHEMTERDHEALLRALLRVRGKVILSGYAHPLYDRLLRGWHRIVIPTRSWVSGDRSPREEVLWLNYRPRVEICRTKSGERAQASAGPRRNAPSLDKGGTGGAGSRTGPGERAAGRNRRPKSPARAGGAGRAGAGTIRAHVPPVRVAEARRRRRPRHRRAGKASASKLT